MGNKEYKKRLGWLADYPDVRDYTIDKTDVSVKLKQVGETESVSDLLRTVGSISGKSKKKQSLPKSIDLREWCSPIENQGNIGSCTAHAGVSLIEYFERRAFGKHIDASRLFLYKVTRNLIHLQGDTGAYCRASMGAITLFGVPPEEFWPYDETKFDQEPPAFCYSFAQNYRAIQYYRLDPPSTPRDELLSQIKANLTGGLPLMFGFTVYGSIESASRMDGAIPFPSKNDTTEGGHAVMAVGFDDEKMIKHPDSNSQPTKGAILIRNSWDASWGEDGYGWLPYEYILRGLAIDWWSLIKKDWIDTNNFQV